MITKRVFRFGELFCGAGGLALGAIQSKFRKANEVLSIQHAWASDYHQDSCKTYSRNIADDDATSVHCCDVRELNIRKLTPIEIFAYGFPCNDFSNVGEKRGFSGEFGPLYRYGVQILDRMKPLAFVAENVAGLLSADNGKSLNLILEDLSNAGSGYILTPHIYEFQYYGVPQCRRRLIIVGIDAKLGLKFRVPAPTTMDRQVTAMEAIETPPIPKDAPNNEKTAQSEVVVERLKHILPGQNAWNATLPKHLQLNVKAARLSHIYKRLDPKLPSYTITGSGGGGTHVYHWSEPRALTNRERARLQTFPDEFIFEGSKESVRRQIGMAVSPAMSQIIFTSLLKTLAGARYACIESNYREREEVQPRLWQD